MRATEYVTIRRTVISENWRGVIMLQAGTTETAVWSCEHEHPAHEDARACANREMEARYDRRNARRTARRSLTRTAR